MNKDENSQGDYFTNLRGFMVERQLISRGINDEKVLRAFRKVPRHKFVPPTYLNESYADYPLPIGCGQTISQPYIVALMTQSLKLKPTDVVLEIGTGSGYQAAIIAEIAAKVYTVERIAILAERAQGLLRDLGYRNIAVKIENGISGWEQKAPFDTIIVTAAATSVPKNLLNQLKETGRLAIPLGGAFSQVLTVFQKQREGQHSSEEICGCVFVPLIDKPAQ